MSNFKVGDLVTPVNQDGYKGIFWVVTDVIPFGKQVYIVTDGNSVHMEQSFYKLYEGI